MVCGWKPWAGVLVALVVAAAMVGVGRAERAREQGYMLRGIDEVRAAVGPSLSRPKPQDYLLLPGRTCLLWAVGARDYALELCADPRGRLVEAVDRRGLTPKFYSLVPEPGAARLHIDSRLVASLVNGLVSPAAPPAPPAPPAAPAVPPARGSGAEALFSPARADIPLARQALARATPPPPAPTTTTASTPTTTASTPTTTAPSPDTWSTASGEFETGIAGWHDSCSGCGQPVRTRDTSKHKFGSASMKVVAFAINQNADFWNVPVVGGARYALSAWVYQQTGRPAMIGLRCATGPRTGGAQVFTVASGVWTRLALTFTTAPTDRACSDLQVMNGQDGPLTYWVDGVTLTKVGG